MDPRNLQSVYAHLRRAEARACVGASPPDFVMWISALGVPTELVELFATCWPQSQIDVVPFQLFEPAQLRKDPDLPRLLAHRLLVLGCCPNGDPLVLDLATDAWVPGAVEHGLLWGDEPEDADPRVYHRPIARSFGELLDRLAAEKWVPRDYWDAQGWDAEDPARRVGG